MVDGRGGEGSGGEGRSMADDKLGIRDREEQPPTSLRHLYGQTKKAARGRCKGKGMVLYSAVSSPLDRSKRLWAAYFKELLNGKGATSCPELPSSVGREVSVEEIGQEEVETAMPR